MSLQYQVQFDEKMMIRAIKTRQMDFLKIIWATNKNFEYIECKEGSEDDADSEEISVDDE